MYRAWVPEFWPKRFDRAFRIQKKRKENRAAGLGSAAGGWCRGAGGWYAELADCGFGATSVQKPVEQEDMKPYKTPPRMKSL